MAHYLLAVVEQLERDAARLTAAYERTNQRIHYQSLRHHTAAPAFRSTGKLTSDLLGFDGPTVNTYGSIATVDYLRRSASAASVLPRQACQLRIAGSTAVEYVGVQLPAPGRWLRAIQ